MNYYLPYRGYFPVKLFGIVFHINIEFLFAAVDFKIVRYPPRVPAGAVSAEGHSTLGDLLTIGACDKDSGHNFIMMPGVFWT